MISRAKYLARQARYNHSEKGRARRARYEAKHPERDLANRPIMRYRARK